MFMKCKPEVGHLCKEEPTCCAKCWIDRKDNITPESKQRDRPAGQVGWHPGWRNHQLIGRNLAFGILEALQEAVKIWSEGVLSASFVLESDYLFYVRGHVVDKPFLISFCFAFALCTSR